MLADDRIKSALSAMIDHIDPPAVPMRRIQNLIDKPSAGMHRFPANFRAGVAAAALIVAVAAAVPASSLGLVQSIEARYRAALQALGGSAPPPAPKSISSALTSTTKTLQSAQAQVPFTIVPPAGLPRDASAPAIRTAPTGIYVKAKSAWHVGSRDVTFSYHRSDGRRFMLLADRFDRSVGPPTRYMFEALDPGAQGRPVIVKHLHFAWRNGDQVMSATAGEGISASEIEHIRAAMHGIALRPGDPHAPNSAKYEKMYRIP